MTAITLTPVVSAAEWEAARRKLLAKEKEHTRAGDVLAAERRRLPRVRIDKHYAFEGPAGESSLLDLFEGRSQLIIYHFMFGPNQDVGCHGCSMVADQICNLAHLRARDTSFALVSRASIAKIERYRQRMGWQLPWYSSIGGEFNVDFGVSTPAPQPDQYEDGESFGLSVLLREGDELFRTYFTDGRALEMIASVWSLLNLTPLGRQEEWEDSPPGYPQTPPYKWWRRHDEYGRDHEC